MRVSALVLSAALLVCAFVYGFFLLRNWEALPDLPVPSLGWHYLAFALVLAPAFAILREAARPARRRQGPHQAEPLWSCCAVGLGAWLWLLLWFAPWRGLVPLDPTGLLALPMFLLFSMGIGVLALGRAASRRDRWIVAVADFGPAVAYVVVLWAGPYRF